MFKITFSKITDTCIFMLSLENNGIDEFGTSLLDLIYSYHMPTSLFVVQVNRIEKKEAIKQKLKLTEFDNLI